MRRRAFISLLGGAAAWPVAARAQQAGKLPTIGLLSGQTGSTAGQWVAAFEQRLRELGWIEGRTAGRAANQIRSRRQSDDDRQGARH